MKWLTKPNFTWADFLFTIVIMRITIPVWVVFFISLAWFTISGILTSKNYHEPLPKN